MNSEKTSKIITKQTCSRWSRCAQKHHTIVSRKKNKEHRKTQQLNKLESSGVSMVWKLGGSLIRAKKNRFFSGNFTQKIDFSGNFKKISIFQGKFRKNIFRQFKKEFRFSRKISTFHRQFHTKNRFFRGNFRKLLIFQVILKKVDFSRQIFEKFRFFRQFPGKIGCLQLFLGKSFYFSSNVTTFEHTSCTW